MESAWLYSVKCEPLKPYKGGARQRLNYFLDQFENVEVTLIMTSLNVSKKLTIFKHFYCNTSLIKHGSLLRYESWT